VTQWLFWGLLLTPTFAPAQTFRPQPYGQLGAKEHLYLLDRSMYGEILNNDFIGNTDKYLTHSTGFSYTYQNQWEFGIYRRLTTPALSYDYGSPKLTQPYGVLADDTTLSVATVFPLSNHLVLYPEINLDLIGNQNAKEVYTFIHRTIGSPLNYDLYGREKRDIDLSPGIKLMYEDTYVYGGGGVYLSPYMEDLYLLGGLKFQVHNFALSGQYKIVNQMGSKYYQDEIRSTRWEWQVGLKWGWYLVYLSYTSPFLQADPVGQYHIAPLNFQWNW
jgi:hypothetical protein